LFKSEDSNDEKISFQIFSSDFNLLVDLLTEKIDNVIVSVSTPNILLSMDFLRLVNLFNYFYFNENCKKSKTHRELRQKLRDLYKDTVFSYMFLLED